jgi:hypothetical protein
VLGERRVREETTALAARGSRWADWPAVNPRRRHAYEEETVEANVASGQSTVASVIVNSHDENIRTSSRRVSPFSDIKSEFTPLTENGEPIDVVAT